MNIKRLIIVCLAVTTLIILKILAHPPEEYTVETYVVQAGDTAWSIAEKHNYTEKDIRELIYYIEKDNGIKAGYLQIGQELIVRIYGDGIDE